ncbi:MAG: hypothetical protein HC851_24735 [Acaryochloris sp. RU_4_1]|nr:hypothetical protein [Acaryochloris sp. RU_4_1]NJR57312.1 hypothetical protein [Acaryochloris sp. CRU_2_0]
MIRNETKTKDTVLRFQSISDSREAQIIDCAKGFYGSRFKNKAELALVDLFEPLYVAVNGGSEQDIQVAIDRCFGEIRDLHRQALNQCQNRGYVFSSQVVLEKTPAEHTPNYDLEDDDPELEFD